MATRKTTSKAKTKTTKKPVARTRATAAKSTSATKKAPAKKTATKKTAAAKASVSKNSPSLTLQTLWKLNLLKAAVFAVLAGLAGFLMSNASYPLSVGYTAKDELVSLTAGNTAFVPGAQAVMDVQVRWLVVATLVIAAAFSLLAATRNRNKYELNLTRGVSPMRWVAWGITSMLMLKTTALLSGVSDIFVLKLIGGIILVTCALAWVAEKRNKQTGRPVWSEYVISLVTGSLPWVLIGGYAVATWVWGLVRYPWFVYALYAALIIGFMLLALNQYKRISGQWNNNLFVERNYLLIGLATKASFAIILIIGFQK